MIIKSNLSYKLKKELSKIRSIPFKYFSSCFGCEWYGKAGASGVYYNYGKIGVKVLRRDGDLFEIKGYPSIQAARRSKEWRIAKEEFEILCKVEPSGFTPKPYCVKVIKCGQYYLPSIIMEHIKGKFSPKGVEEKVSECINQLYKLFNITLQDHYEYNFIRKPDGSIVIIDFGPN